MRGVLRPDERLELDSRAACLRPRGRCCRFGSGARPRRSAIISTPTRHAAPGFFDFVVLGAPGPGASGSSLADPNPPSTPNRLAQVEPKRPADSIAAAVRRNVRVPGRNGFDVRQEGGPARQGLVLRFADEKNFLVLLVDPVTGRRVLSSYRDGKPTELGRGRAASSALGAVRGRRRGAGRCGALQRQEALRGAGPEAGGGARRARDGGPGRGVVRRVRARRPSVGRSRLAA